MDGAWASNSFADFVAILAEVADGLLALPDGAGWRLGRADRFDDIRVIRRLDDDIPAASA